jgi:ABC-type Fe3+ transport system permease subunit
MVLLSCLFAILIGAIGLYFVAENFRSGRETGIIFIRGMKYERKESNGWFRVAWFMNWLVAAVFGGLIVGGILIGVLAVVGDI